MKKSIIIIVVLVFVIGGYFLSRHLGVFSDSTVATDIWGLLEKPDVARGNATPEALAEISQYEYTETYMHPKYKFTFKYPKGFTVSDIPSDEGETILVQNVAKNIGVQILITPFVQAELNMTAEVVQSELPDLKIQDEEEVIIGVGRKGVAFVSNNEAFGGRSREVWFVFRSNLYQISTYAQMDEFIKGLFATWKFQ